MRGNQPNPPYNPPPPGWQAPPPEYLAQYQPIRVPRQRPRRSMGCCSCVLTVLIPAALGLLILLAAYFLAPLNTQFLVLGIDRVPDGTALGRSDTMIVVSVNPLLPTVKMLSIPRDLWVSIPGVGENRINTAHFFAEAQSPGSGPISAVQTVEQNFGLRIPYYVRLRFDAFLSIVDALGGVTVDLPSDMGGLTAGRHHLDGTQALAFVRDRQGTDDFFRMERGQLMLKAVAKEMLLPTSWARIPSVISAGFSSVDTNIPFWQWPRLGLAVVRAGITDSIDSSTIRREMTTPYITGEGANVLLPDWNQIHPFVDDIFAQ